MAAEPAQARTAGVQPEGRALLGALLVHCGALAPADLERALFEKERTGKQLGQVLVELGLITTRTLAEALSHQHGLEFVDLTKVRIDEEAVALLPEAIARRYHALPVGFDDGALLVAVSDPTDLMAHDDLRLALGTDTRIVVADRTELDAAIAEAYHLPLDSVETFSGSAHAPSVEDLREASAESAPVIKLINELIGRALKERASDIHFAPGPDELVVRVRVDGVTRQLATIPASLQPAVIARLKVMGALDIAQRRIPQDGRVDVRVGGQPLDLRIAVLPTVFGEQVVLRILHGSFKGRLAMSDLGMGPETEAILRRAIGHPGAIVACGPTGSGKTTTLYAALDLLNEPGRVIVTIEDPVEYQVPGIAQIEIDPIAGLTFARGLRTILRSDPDVILVGEVRDEETARIAMQAATTGHVVLTTLHAQSASGAIVRLKDMGVDAGLLAPSVNCIIAQRLARRLCLKCREPYSPSDAERRDFGLDRHGSGLELYRARGCEDCQHTGYEGRVAMYEAMLVEGKLRRLIASSSGDIFATAVEQGMTTLRESGIALAVAGTTSLDEVQRILGDRAL